MGAPMARNLLKGGFEIKAYDVSREAVEALAEAGASPAESPADAARGCDQLITMLPNGEIVENALFGPAGVAESLPRDALYIDMSTILPAQTDRIAKRLSELGIHMVDAPVGRSSQHAVEGKLLIMAGGDASDLERARPVLDCLGDTIVHCGPVGSGGRMKIVNNYMSIALNVLTAESLTMAERAGLDPEQAREVMLGTVAGQGHMGTTYPAKVLKGDLKPGFMVDLAHKDMGLALAMAADMDAPSWMGAVAHQAYGLARRDGRGRQDWTALYETLRSLALGDARKQAG